MKPDAAIAQQLESQSVVLMESTIPGVLSMAAWRRSRSALACNHLHDTTSRYDHDQKLLHFLQVCDVCGTEKLIETVPYEPRFTPHATDEPIGATIHQLPVRRGGQPLRRAA